VPQVFVPPCNWTLPFEPLPGQVVNSVSGEQEKIAVWLTTYHSGLNKLL
jgi:hypothetical protein